MLRGRKDPYLNNYRISYNDTCMILRQQITVTRYIIDLSLRKMHEYLFCGSIKYEIAFKIWIRAM